MLRESPTSRPPGGMLQSTHFTAASAARGIPNPIRDPLNDSLPSLRAGTDLRLHRA